MRKDMNLWLSDRPIQQKSMLRRVLFSCTLLVLLIFVLNSSAPHPMSVTLVPRSIWENGASQFLAVSGKADPAHQQIALRTVTSLSLPQVAVIASPPGILPAHRATGELTFINNTAQSITLSALTLVGTHHVPVTFSGPLTIPARDPPAVMTMGVATLPGSRGEIPVFDIDQACCHAGIVVKNTTAFTLAPKTLQSRIGDLIAQMTSTVQQDTLLSLARQRNRNERVVPGPTTCRATPAVKQENTTIIVTVALLYTEHVYDEEVVHSIAMHVLLAQARGDPRLGSEYTVVGPFHFSETMTPIAGREYLNVQVWGRWVAHFTPARLFHLAQMIAGKQPADARALLLRQTEILDVSFSCKGTLPGAENIVMLSPSSLTELYATEGGHQ